MSTSVAPFAAGTPEGVFLPARPAEPLDCLRLLDGYWRRELSLQAGHNHWCWVCVWSRETGMWVRRGSVVQRRQQTALPATIPGKSYTRQAFVAA